MEKVSANNRPNIVNRHCVELMVRFKSVFFSLCGIGAADAEMEYHPYIGETPKYGCIPICKYLLRGLGGSVLRSQKALQMFPFYPTKSPFLSLT